MLAVICDHRWNRGVSVPFRIGQRLGGASRGAGNRPRVPHEVLDVLDLNQRV